MEPKFQSSFIPKSPVVNTKIVSTPSVSTSINFLPSIATLLFVLALAAWGGLWGYGHYLQTELTTSQQALAAAQASFDPQTTNNLLVASQRIQLAEGLVQNHVAVSNLFNLLQQNILPQVSFNSFTFAAGSNGTITMAIDGSAASYAILAEQSQVLHNLSYVSNQSFDNLALSDKGDVTWSFSATVDPKSVTYIVSIPVTPVTSTTTP